MLFPSKSYFSFDNRQSTEFKFSRTRAVQYIYRRQYGCKSKKTVDAWQKSQDNVETNPLQLAALHFYDAQNLMKTKSSRKNTIATIDSRKYISFLFSSKRLYNLFLKLYSLCNYVYQILPLFLLNNDLISFVNRSQ